ncbi:MAG: KpsF/GutQ family sugar-phosphate isomerase [Proteobacteria bacterium]|jgi:arabinose-5-phosphate isomerase|nr:KpsF/GutQ family sugar-phosphate isomerase [Pseudomonadota bacterium]
MSLKTIELAKSVLDIEAQAVLQLKSRIDEHFLKAVDLMLATKGKVVLCGIGKSGQMARKISSTLSSTGTPSVFVHPAESAHGDLGTITKEDLVIAISYGGESPEIVPLLTYVARKGIPLIAMTGKTQSSLAKAAQVVLDISVAREACPLELAPTSSSTATLAMGDALAMAVMDRKGFSAEDFAENHPGGSLGFRLSRVRDVMHTGAGFVVVTEETPLRQVISKMSQAETRGAASIVGSQGDLIGIITDGDVRRRLESSSDPLNGVAKDMMTKSPRAIEADELVEKALFLMEQFRINVLFVLDSAVQGSRKPVGVVHIQDLLRNKVR